jgi:hypothetical protein
MSMLDGALWFGSLLLTTISLKRFANADKQNNQERQQIQEQHDHGATN